MILPSSDMRDGNFYKTCKKYLWLFFTLLNFLPNINVLYGTENQSAGMDANGSIVVVWQENTNLGTEIKASALPVGAPLWEVPVILSSSQMASLPKLAVIANGLDTLAVAIWVEVIGGIAHLYGAMRPSLLGSWTASVLISDGIEEVLGGYQLILNSTGDIVATWTSVTGGNLEIRSSKTVINIANTWGVPTQINL